MAFLNLSVQSNKMTSLEILLDTYKKAVLARDKQVVRIFKALYETDTEDIDDIQFEKVDLSIGISSIPGAGLGVFAKKKISAGKIIGSFGGPVAGLKKTFLNKRINLGSGEFQSMENSPENEKLLTEAQLSYSMTVPIVAEPPYECIIYPSLAQLSLHQLNYKDLKASAEIIKKMNWTVLMNDAKDPEKNNTVVIENGYINTTREIEAGEELFLEYGVDYWKDKSSEIYITHDMFDNIKQHADAMTRQLLKIWAMRTMSLKTLPLSPSQAALLESTGWNREYWGQDDYTSTILPYVLFGTSAFLPQLYFSRIEDVRLPPTSPMQSFFNIRILQELLLLFSPTASFPLPPFDDKVLFEKWLIKLCNTLRIKEIKDADLLSKFNVFMALFLEWKKEKGTCGKFTNMYNAFCALILSTKLWLGIPTFEAIERYHTFGRLYDFFCA